MSKEQKLWDSVKDMAEWSGKEALLLQAICRLLSHSDRPTRQKPAKIPDNKAKVIQARLQLECPQVNVATYSSGELGRLTRTLNSIHDFRESDIDTLIAWIHDGNLDWWDTPPTLHHVANHFSNWLAQARLWAEGEPEQEHRGSAIR